MSRVRSVPRNTGCRRESDQRRGRHTDGSPTGIAHRVLGEERGGVRAGPEERRLPERHDAAVAQDQVDETANSARIAISFHSAA
jgi:hypothetical protein